jgi:hypothetical protein
MTDAEQGDNVIGEFRPFTYRITCEREPEVGIAWMACIKELSICAMGDTPKEAGENLFKALKIGGQGKLYEGNCESLKETGSTWRSIR